MYQTFSGRTERLTESQYLHSTGTWYLVPVLRKVGKNSKQIFQNTTIFGGNNGPFLTGEKLLQYIDVIIVTITTFYWH